MHRLVIKECIDQKILRRAQDRLAFCVINAANFQFLVESFAAREFLTASLEVLRPEPSGSPRLRAKKLTARAVDTNLDRSSSGPPLWLVIQHNAEHIAPVTQLHAIGTVLLWLPAPKAPKLLLLGYVAAPASPLLNSQPPALRF
jgi:hypothetical protein